MRIGWLLSIEYTVPITDTFFPRSEVYARRFYEDRNRSTDGEDAGGNSCEWTRPRCRKAYATLRLTITGVLCRLAQEMPRDRSARSNSHR